MLSRPRQRGFSLVELMIGVALIAVILGLAAPAMGTYLQNSKIANATQDYFSGLQTARTEAIHRNVPVEFALTDTAVNTVNLANVLAPSATGLSWAVRASDPAPSAAYTLVEAKSGHDGANDASSLSGVQVAVSGPVGFAGLITFNGFGGTSDGLPYAIDISNSAAGVCAAIGGPIRCRRITITPGGRISACDPAALAADSRFCQP